jgi:hypothetical protein
MTLPPQLRTAQQQQAQALAQQQQPQSFQPQQPRF